MPKSVVIEALSRSLKASLPLPYAGSIIKRWVDAGVKSYRDIQDLDREFNKEILS